MGLVRHLVGRAIFPPRYAWFLEGRWRSVVLSPRRLAGRLALTPQLTVLEIGAGGGYYAHPLSALVCRFIALDIQAAMLERLRKRPPVSSLMLVRADAGRLPFPDRSVDLAIAVTVLGEVGSAETTIGEVRRVLRPGGTFSASEHWPDPDFLPFDQVRGWCEASGLRLAARFGSRHNYTANFTAAEP
jgi:ubiquinone/menaquinone biosynthesis C-methylase UbiE